MRPLHVALPLLVGACTEISAPAERLDAGVSDAAEADGSAASDAGDTSRCRQDIAAETFTAVGILYTRPGKGRLFVTSVTYLNESVNNLYAMAFVGDPASFKRDVVDLARPESALASCTRCAFAMSPCDSAGNTCKSYYVPKSGKMRAVKLPKAAGEPFWLELDRVTFVRADLRGDRVEAEHPDDCLFNEHTLLSGIAQEAPLDSCGGLGGELLCALVEHPAR